MDNIKRIIGQICVLIYVLVFLTACGMMESVTTSESSGSIWQDDLAQGHRDEQSGCESVDDAVHQAEGNAVLETEDVSPIMEVHFLDLGQSDSTLVINGEHAMLIDAGENEYGIALQYYLQQRGIKKLDYLILTHPDSDHVGGADVVIYKLPVGEVMMQLWEKDTITCQDVLTAMDDRHLVAAQPELGKSYLLGDASFQILGPIKAYADGNDTSISLMLQKGEKKFLFTGDAQEPAEKDMLLAGIDLQADVYQVGHHGSKTSSSENFLEAVSPTYAVISCGMGNAYGYPHAAVLNLLRERQVQVFRTDEQGSIVAYCDGTSITWNCPPSDSWLTGQDRSETETSPPDPLPAEELFYLVNKKNGTVHTSRCVNLPKVYNQILFGSLEEVRGAGYDRYCQNCLAKP